MDEREIPDELIDQLLGEYEGPEQLTGPDGLINRLRRRLIERAAGAELDGQRECCQRGDAAEADEPLDDVDVRRRAGELGDCPVERVGSARISVYLTGSSDGVVTIAA